MADYRVNHMIQTVCRAPEAIARLNEDPEKVFEEFGLTDEEKQAFRDGSLEAMGAVGIHPILQMHYFLARDPNFAKRMSILEYDGLVKED